MYALRGSRRLAHTKRTNHTGEEKKSPSLSLAAVSGLTRRLTAALCCAVFASRCVVLHCSMLRYSTLHHRALLGTCKASGLDSFDRSVVSFCVTSTVEKEKSRKTSEEDGISWDGVVVVCRRLFTLSYDGMYNLFRGSGR
jgi:hypothetical protein